MELRSDGRGLLLAAALSTACASAPVSSAPVDRWRAEHLSAERGGRRYYVALPSAYDGHQRLPLVIMLHGCTQDPEDFARGTRMNAAADRRGYVVVYPEQPESGNPRKCWNWFDSRHQERGAGEPAELAAITESVLQSYPIDRARVFVAGMSAGGAMAVVMAATYPELFAGVGVHSGIAYRLARSPLEALEAMRGSRATPSPIAGSPALPPLIAIQGAADAIVVPANLTVLLEQWGAPAPAVGGEQNESGGYAWRRGGTANGRVRWLLVESLGHAWSGGDSSGTFADPHGPSAADAMLDFFSSLRR